MATKELQQDAQLATNLVLGPIFSGDGIKQLVGVMSKAGQDTAGALAHVLFLNFQHAKQAIQQNQLNIDSKVWIAKGGVIERVISEVLAILASTLGSQFASPALAKDTKTALLQLLHGEETASGGPGDPSMQADDEEDEAAPDDEGTEQPPQGPPQGGLIAPPGAMSNG